MKIKTFLEMLHRSVLTKLRNIPRNYSPSVSADESKNILRNAASVSANEIRNIPRNSPSVSADESKTFFEMLHRSVLTK